MLHRGKNSIVIIASPLLKQHEWNNVNMDADLLQIIAPAAT